MSTPTPEEARQALAEIDGISRQMRQVIRGDGLVSSILILWGVLWMAIFAAGYWSFPHGDSYAWPLNGLGFFCTAWLVARRHKQVRSEAGSALMKQIGMLWIALIAFAFLLPLLLRIPAWNTRLALTLSLVMLGYVIQGIWMKDRVFVALGLFITASILACHAWLSPRDFLLGLGILGGGGLLVGGFAIRLRWR